MARNDSSKVLIFGGSGYIGSYIVRASIKLGHPTYVYSRPNSTKADLLNEFQSLGVKIVKGELDEHEKLVSVLKEVDVVISVLAYPQVLDQFKIIDAIKNAGNIKRFLPSDFGVEEDSITVLPPFQTFLNKKKMIRRAIEEAGIPFTFVSANCYAGYFVNLLLHPNEKGKDITVYGNGHAKVVLNYEEDVGFYTIRVATDPRARNRVVVYRPSTNIISQLELISLWKKKTSEEPRIVHVSEEELVAFSKTFPEPENIKVCILHSIFVKGDTTNFNLEEKKCLEASKMYPDLKFRTIEEILDVFMQNPPKPYLAAFE